MKDIKTAEEFYDTTNYEVELWDAEQQKNGVSCNQLMRFAQQYAEYYHKAKVEEYPPICRRCDCIIRTELNQD